MSGWLGKGNRNRESLDSSLWNASQSASAAWTPRPDSFGRISPQEVNFSTLYPLSFVWGAGVALSLWTSDMPLLFEGELKCIPLLFSQLCLTLL